MNALNAYPIPIDRLTPFGRKLIWVVAGLALAVVPHIPHLAPWIVVLAAGAICMRIAADIKRWGLPPKWLRIVIAFGALLAVLFDYRTLNGVEAGTALLVVMAGMKLMETRTVRDLTVVVFLAYFALFSALLYSQDLLRLPYLLGSVWLLTATLMRIHQTTLSMPAREALGLTGKMLLQAMPLAILLFLLFPRLPGNFWSIPARTEAITGLDDEVSPGDVSELSVSSAIAFRVKFAGELPPPRERYWRGPVLHDFDGRTWRRPLGFFIPQETTGIGTAYRYRLTLEPHQRPWVFGLDLVTGWPESTRRASDFQLQLKRDVVSVLTSFDLESFTQYRVEGSLPTRMRQAYLRLPENRNPRTQALARQLRAASTSDEAFIAAVLEKFQSEEYFYTLEPPRLERDSVDDFLFNTRRGFCEHFASAFTALARAAGIPARLVTGYHGGEVNPMGNYLIVRQSDAHAWSEVWIDSKGWMRVDPTAAVAPERVESAGLYGAMSDNEPVPGRLVRNSAFLSNVRFAWDAANTFWNDQIVEFSADQQQRLSRLLGVEELDVRTLGTALVLVFVAFFLSLSGYLAWKFRPRLRDPVRQVYEQLCRKLARAQLAKLPHEGPQAYLDRIAAQRPEIAPRLREAKTIYLDLRYGPAPMKTSLSRLKHVVNQLKVRRV